MGANGSGQVDAGPRAHRSAAAGDRVAAASSARRSTTSTTGGASASCRSAAAPGPAYPRRCGRSSRPAGSPTAGCCVRSAARDRAAIADALEVVGLAHRARDGVSTLSGGQQQRVLIARALAGEPELFFLDEPTAGVDLPNQQVLADTLETLSERGSTIVLVAHELGPMAPLIDRAVVMRDGRVAYDGPPLASAEVATAHLDGHHHHHPEPDRHDHAPHVSSLIDGHRGTAMNDFLDLLGLPFMQRAIIAAIFTGLAAPAVGTYLVQRRLALMGDGIGHVAVTGVALGLLTGTSPTWTAVIVAVLGAVADRGDPRARPRQRRRRAGAALLRRPRRRRADHRARRPERRHAAALPLRLDHHDVRRPT